MFAIAIFSFFTLKSLLGFCAVLRQMILPSTFSTQFRPIDGASVIIRHVFESEVLQANF